MLAVQKQWYKISMSNWDNHIVLINKNLTEPNWQQFILDKEVVVIDWKTLNFSFCVWVVKIDLDDKKNNTCDARSRSLPNWLRQVAEFYMNHYQSCRSTETVTKKISLPELEKRVNAFMSEWKDLFYKKQMHIYKENWWDINLIWPK
jgi:hypothetical protein